VEGEYLPYVWPDVDCLLVLTAKEKARGMWWVVDGYHVEAAEVYSLSLLLLFVYMYGTSAVGYLC